MEQSWEKAIKRVLAESDTPLHYAEISERALLNGYYKTSGATPAATVNARIASSIKHDKEKTPFIRVGKGVFTLKSILMESVEVSPSTSKKALETNIGLDANEPEGSIIHSFGMYWKRDLVVWRNNTKMYGKQQALSKQVDFGGQNGIYILYDHHNAVYVGRSIDRPLGKRLYEHTIDRLGSRWNQFSWFGLLDVTQEGDLKKTNWNASLASLIATFEALLIETLEPPQNRKRGDDFSGIEYIQGTDPELKEREIKNTIYAIEQKMRGGA